jgi:hypothetical protein
MMKTRKLLTTFAAASLLTLAGCAAPGPKFSGLQNVPKERAELVVYRKSALFASGQTMPVLIDGKEEGQLYNGSYLQQSITPGQHFIKITTGMFGKPGETVIQLAAGERKFLHFDFPTGPLANGFFIGVTLDERGEAAALEDLKELSSAKPEVSAKQ